MSSQHSLGARVTSGLRFRLTLTYVLFFALMLGFLGVFFRQTIARVYEDQLHNILTEEWSAVRAYLRIEKPKGKGAKKPDVNWYYDRDDPEEALIVDRLRQVFLLADATGKPLETGPKYRELHVEPAEEIRAAMRHAREPQWHTRHDKNGTAYLIRSDVLIAEDDKPYYVAIGRTLNERQKLIDEFTWYYAWMLPVMILSGSVLGWYMAGRALQPVNNLAQTAQRITGSNLTVQIPLRGSGDELDRLIEAFNRMVERLDQSFRQTRQFSTDVSHELRTPLTAIRGQLEVALMAARTQEQYRDAIVEALQDVERLSQTIRALLLLSQAESGQVTLQKQVIELSAVLEDIVDQFGIPAESEHIQLTSSIPPRIRIQADRVQIERLTSNLISNALKYTPSGGQITVTLADMGHEVRLEVADTGVGIAPDHLPYIFDRFYRVPDRDRSSSPERGLGLGLSFVAWIVKAHGGRIDVHSTPGAGSTFRVRLPKGQVPDPETVAEPARPVTT